jgi:hypothetical protein
MIPEAALPALYAPWLRSIAGGPIPAEVNATCDRCAMLAPPGARPDAAYFRPDTKCCAYQPSLPNFLAGRLLSESDPSMAEGRKVVEARIARRVAVKPSKVGAGGVFPLLYGATPFAFGRAPALRCHYLSPDGECGVWKHRPGVCATWFCKHVRGATGQRFWKLADKLLREVERDLAYWCMAQHQVGFNEAAEPDSQARPHVSELDGDIDWAQYRRLWGSWAGRETEFYQACARLVETLTWEQVAERCGPRVGILAGLVRDACIHLQSLAIPERLQINQIRITDFDGKNYRVIASSAFDPLLMSARLAGVLRYFDGRPTEEALEAILAEQNLRLDASLVRKLVDFEILKAAGSGEDLLPILS